MNTENTGKTRLTDRKRAAIVQAAVSEFRSHGFDNTSMDRIAAAASVSKRTVYNHFPSKEALFEAIVERLMARTLTMTEYPYDSEEVLAQQLTRIGHRAIETVTSDDFQDLARVVLSRLLQSPHLARQIAGESKPFDEGLARWIRAACKDQRLDVSDPLRAAKQFNGLLNAFAFWPQIVGSDPPLSRRQSEAIVKSAVSMFLDHYAV